MPDFLLELLSEEIPARMQAKAREDLARLFAAEIAKAGLKAHAIEAFSTPRRLALIARGLPEQTEAVSEELKGPRTSAPPQALEGFLRKTGLSQDQLSDCDGVWFAVIDKPGRATASVLAEAIPAIVRAFPWPKSMRWGAASVSTESLRWVRPLQGIVALLGEEIVPFEIDGIHSGAATIGHRFHHPGRITIGSADDYAEKLRMCHVIVDQEEREKIIAEGAANAAEQAGLTLVQDDALLKENAGLTEWPVPLLGAFDPAFLDVPPEVIQLTMAVNQKYFAVQDQGGKLAPNFICTANIEAHDRGAAIVAGNRKVLAARLSDAKFFWEQDLKVPLEEQAKKLDQIVFHEKLGTVADKVERVAKLVRWLVEEGIVGGSIHSSATNSSRHPRESGDPVSSSAGAEPLGSRFRGNDEEKKQLADMAEQAARLCKADLVTGMVGEFPELQGVMGGYYARAQGHPDAVADAIRNHYKPIGQGDDVPTAPVTVAVSLADKLDNVVSFNFAKEFATGSKDPFALRRAAVGVIAIVLENELRLPILKAANLGWQLANLSWNKTIADPARQSAIEEFVALSEKLQQADTKQESATFEAAKFFAGIRPEAMSETSGYSVPRSFDFLIDRLKVQQREAGVRHDLIDAVFALGGEDDLVRLLARVKALQSFVETAEGRDLLAGYKRAANILKKEGWNPLPAGEGRLAAGERGEDDRPSPSPSQPSAGPLPLPGGEGQVQSSYTPEPEEHALIAALDAAEPRARVAVTAEDFEGAMAALASLRAPVDTFFEKVTVNDPDPAKREARLNLLARMRDAVHQVADFSRIEG